MVSFRALNTDNNPIMQAELAYQRRLTPPHPFRRRWLGRIVALLAVTVTLILFGGEVVGALLYRDPTSIGDWFGFGTTLLVIGVVAQHFLLLFRTLSLAANTIAREQHGHTWDMLVLTGVDARRIVRGKWWATVRRQWRAYALLAVLRGGVVVWYGASTSRFFTSTLAAYGAYYSSSHYLSIPRAEHLLLAAVLVAALTLVNLGFTAAVGVAASAEMRSPVLTLARALFLRLLVLVVAAALLSFLALLLSYLLAETLPIAAFSLTEWLNRLSIVLVDNGFSLGAELSNYHWSQPNYPTVADNPVGYGLLAAFTSLALYALFTWMLLRLAQRQAVRQHALPPPLD
ncbi:MAG TPA: hypothetical protein VHO69_17055 [Phototrophicaceae bacterium]|nr:hypothetical protein [Phototrophicaceae bacterium]